MEKLLTMDDVATVTIIQESQERINFMGNFGAFSSDEALVESLVSVDIHTASVDVLTNLVSWASESILGMAVLLTERGVTDKLNSKVTLAEAVHFVAPLQGENLESVNCYYSDNGQVRVATFSDVLHVMSLSLDMLESQIS